MVAPRMSIKFLGTSSMPNSTRNYSSLLFKLDNHTVMVDCGEGTQRQLRSRYVGVDERLSNLKTILVTHLHADHVLGLVPLLMSMMGPSGVSPATEAASPRVEIYGPPGLRALIRTTLSLCYSQLSGKYVVHEFVWPRHDQLPDGSPHALTDQPERTIPDLPLHEGESSTGRNLDMDPRSFSWPNFLSLKTSSQAPGVRISAAPISHRCPTLAYVFEEEARAPPLDPSIAEALKRNGPALLEQRGIRHPLSLLSTLTAQRRSLHLPDGTVLDPPPLSLPGRKVTVMGDTSDGTGGFSEMQLRAGYGLPALAYGSDVLVHESTNIALPSHLNKNGKPDSFEDVAAKAKSRGHSVPQGAGRFAALVNAKRLILNHFSTKYPSPPHYLLDSAGTNAESTQLQSQNQQAAQDRQLGDPERKALIMKEFEVQAYRAWQQQTTTSQDAQLETYSAFDGFHFEVPARPEQDAAAPQSEADVFAKPWEQSTAAENGNGLKRKLDEQGAKAVGDEKVWDPSPLLVPSSQNQVARYAMVLLNSPIDARQIGHFRRLWDSASLRLCADGAVNRLLDTFGAAAFEVQNGQSAVPLPNAIVGDLDSIRPDTQRFFESKGVAVHVRPSQYATDLQKTIQEIEDQEAASGEGEEHTLVIYGGLAGRLDQSVHTLHVLWQLAPGTPDLGSVMDPEGKSERGNRLRKRQRTFAIGDGSVAWLLPQGKHVLHMSRRVMGKTCGILPLGVGSSGAKVSTKGLEWNLNGDSTTLGGFLSTSNHLYDEKGVVRVENDEPVYWTVELRPDDECSL
ncbi:related to Ribonuclease Z / related to thiamin pyrophosphokinase 1 [Sporisorium reilianum f. sp. reilianum]|uniref:Related to Ribonuclease Z / related to thiamin pyrophosphokinase 1 n=1 Tax=Sporisorium reilianum f. sp. reilianum TaxID=72559 RepID=A0A2N8UG02_9BASI|nr:related to Ribonuclease Z / related to thiamin pyrophosphokinase 1 [Sporisorium reilianum f. sp. reilianum]